MITHPNRPEILPDAPPGYRAISEYERATLYPPNEDLKLVNFVSGHTGWFAYTGRLRLRNFRPEYGGHLHIAIRIESKWGCPYGKIPISIGGVDGYISEESAKELVRMLNETEGENDD